MRWRMNPSRWLLATGGDRPVDRDLVEVRPAEADELRVGVREEPPLEQRVVREVDAGHDVADVEGDLLRLREEVVRVAVERQRADPLRPGTSSSG